MAQINRTMEQVVQQVALARGINVVLNRAQVLGTTADFDLTPEVVEVLNKVLPSVVIPPDGVSPVTMTPPKAEPGAAEAAKPAAATKPATRCQGDCGHASQALTSVYLSRPRWERCEAPRVRAIGSGKQGQGLCPWNPTKGLCPLDPPAKGRALGTLSLERLDGRRGRSPRWVLPDRRSSVGQHPSRRPSPPVQPLQQMDSKGAALAGGPGAQPPGGSRAEPWPCFLDPIALNPRCFAS